MEIEILSKYFKYFKNYKEVPISYSGRSYEEGKKLNFMTVLSMSGQYLSFVLNENISNFSFRNSFRTWKHVGNLDRK